MGILAGCGGSRNDPGLTNPDPPPQTDSISGSVTFKGSPLAGVAVTLWLTNTNSVMATATTDAGGNYSFTGLKTTGNVPAEYHLWATRAGYGFSPSVGSGAKVVRADHTGQFVQAALGVPMYLAVIDYLALPNASITDANFTAFDGSNPVVTVAATGQTQTYAPGDDGAFAKGIGWSATRWTDNRNGTITDNLTGLIWLKDAGCLAAANWSGALTEANQLASGACGLSDGSTAGQWRLPNLPELESLVDVSAADGGVSAGSPFVHVAHAIYWSSTSYFGGQKGSPNAWAIRMTDGRYINDGVLNTKQGVSNAVWAVRGGGSAPGRLQASGLFVTYQSGDDGALQMGVPLMYPRFIDHNDGTVTDAMTGLVWLKLANCVHGDWATALGEIQSLASGQCGLSDGSVAGQWRMPNRNEMQSLADRNQNNESDYLNYTFRNLDGSVFQAAVLTGFISQQYYWTATTDAADVGSAWTVYSCDFGVYDTAKSEEGYTLAVR